MVAKAAGSRSVRSADGTLRTALASGEPLVGTFIKSCDVDLFEAGIDAGFDYLILDLQHSSLTVGDASTFCAIAIRAGVPLIARIAPAQTGLIGSLLDAGIQGIQCTDADVALGQTVSRCAHYPPSGERSFSPSTRAARRAATSMQEQIARANADVVLIGQVESVAAVEGIDELIGAGHWHALFLGPVDLHVDLLAHRPAGPPLDEVLRKAARSIVSAGLPLGIFVRSIEDAVEWAGAGASLLTIGSDVALLTECRRQQIATWRAARKHPSNRTIHH